MSIEYCCIGSVPKPFHRGTHSTLGVAYGTLKDLAFLSNARWHYITSFRRQLAMLAGRTMQKATLSFHALSRGNGHTCFVHDRVLLLDHLRSEEQVDMLLQLQLLLLSRPRSFIRFQDQA